MSPRRLHRLASIALAAAVVLGALGTGPIEPVGAAVGGIALPCDPARPETCTLSALADELGIRIGATAEASEVEPGP